MSGAPLEISSLTGAELVAHARDRVPRGHGAAGAIYRDALLHGRFEPVLHGLGPEAAAAWRAGFTLTVPSVCRHVAEASHEPLPTEAPAQSTDKLVLRLADGLECESVLLPMGRGRSTLCISSQVGCKMGCTFCETGRMGLLRNLSTAEIVGQLIAARAHVAQARDHVLRNVVFMGMGEALDNADNVLQALRVMTDPAGLAIAQERITVCTVGRVEGIAKLAAVGMKRLNLSVSLNAPEDGLRSSIMPVNRTLGLSELQAALAAYRPRANFALGVNYCLLPGINDAREHATGIARFCAPLGRVMVNVIPYNPGHAPLTRAPEEPEVERFIGYLREEGVPVRRRVTKGRSVMAACGQLGNVELRRRKQAREPSPPALE